MCPRVQAPAAGAEPEPEKEEGGEEGGEQEEAVGGDGEERADERDVFGEDDSDNEEPKQRKFSRLTQQDSEGSADDDNKSDKEGSDKGEGSGKEGRCVHLHCVPAFVHVPPSVLKLHEHDSDEEESPKKRKKDKESRKRDKKEKKKKRKREEKEESAKKRKRRSGGGSNAGSGGEEPANDEFTEKNVFQESDDDAEERDEGIDLETNEVVASKQKKGKFTKKEKAELRRAELQRINTFVSKLKRAALDDRNAFKERRMATRKMEMLDELKNELLRARTQQDYLEAGILNSLKLWLDPLDHEAKTFKARANSLPNKKLLAETLQLIYDLPMENIKRTTEKGNVTTFHDNMDKVEDSEIGRSVRFIQNAMETGEQLHARTCLHTYTNEQAHAHTFVRPITNVRSGARTRVRTTNGVAWSRQDAIGIPAGNKGTPKVVTHHLQKVGVVQQDGRSDG